MHVGVCKYALPFAAREDYLCTIRVIGVSFGVDVQRPYTNVQSVQTKSYLCLLAVLVQ